MNSGQNIKDYYYILGVSPESTHEEIEEAYNTLYDKYGPHVTLRDQDPQVMESAFKDLCEAWETLSDSSRRQQYDRHNLPLIQKNHLRALWGKFTGTSGQESEVKRGAPDHRLAVEITLKEALKGAEKKVRFDDALVCQHCYKKKQVERLQCPHCHGSALIRNERLEKIEVPKGAYDKMEIRLSGKGKFDARLQKYGDLVIIVEIKPHSYFSVLGQDLACTVPVTVYEAVLGGEIEVPTPKGKVIMKIQPLTQHGRIYRLKGLGLAGADLLVTIEATVPRQLSTDEVLLFRKLNECSTQPNPRSGIFATLAAEDQAES